MKPPFTLFLALVLSACSVAPEVREDAVEALAVRHRAAAEQFLSSKTPLTLADCIRIAEERNLDLRAAELEQQLAGIDTDIAFSSFLPKIEASWSRTNLTEAPLVTLGGPGVQTSDQRASELSIGLEQPIFVPQTWLIYSARQKGEEISALVRERTRQQIVLAVTARYYACLFAKEEIAALELEVLQAERLQADTVAREREGLVTGADVKEVELLLMAREEGMERGRRTLSREKSGLLRLLDLPPLEVVELSGEPDLLRQPEEDLAALVTQALLSRPELFVADRSIDIRREEVEMAIADFLPKLFGTGGYFDTTDSYLINPAFFSYGLAGVLTVFDGLANVRKLDAAEVREERELLERERTALAVILEVIDAHRGVEDAAAARRVLSKRLEVVTARAAEIEELWSEGLVLDSDRLEVLSVRDRARSEARSAAYREQVAIATLSDVTGGIGSDLQ
jgi:outer membrane protein TolC